MTTKQINRLKNTFLQYGVKEDIAMKLINLGYSVTKLRTTKKNELSQYFDEEREVEEVLKKIKRQPIPTSTMKKIVEETEMHCCFCWNLKKEKPIAIHHITPYHETQDNSYDNLVVLCLNHHGEVHTKREISAQNFPPHRIKSKRNEWITELARYRKGLRVAPGEEDTLEKPHNHTDIEALDKFTRILFAREALFQDFAWEFNYDNFYKSIRTVVNGLRNGKLVDIEVETKPLSMFSNSLWKKKLTKVSRLLEQVARTYKRGLQDKRFEFEENGRVNIHDKTIINEINHTRYEVLIIINEILEDAEMEKFDEYSINLLSPKNDNK